MLRAISCVAAFCCSTAEAMPVEIPLISLTIFPMPSIDPTASCVAAWMSPI